MGRSQVVPLDSLTNRELNTTENSEVIRPIEAQSDQQAISLDAPPIFAAFTRQHTIRLLGFLSQILFVSIIFCFALFLYFWLSATYENRAVTRDDLSNVARLTYQDNKTRFYIQLLESIFAFVAVPAQCHLQFGKSIGTKIFILAMKLFVFLDIPTRILVEGFELIIKYPILISVNPLIFNLSYILFFIKLRKLLWQEKGIHLTRLQLIYFIAPMVWTLSLTLLVRMTIFMFLALPPLQQTLLVSFVAPVFLDLPLMISKRMLLNLDEIDLTWFILIDIIVFTAFLIRVLAFNLGGLYTRLMVSVWQCGL
eukprot:TRINITY_DN18759_c0_g1::TRINITY_DN18759_c0_g1_i1::g.15245::m.15245 TRINITY_DN18759_c0_g1::TRINITY_DN18759_c0_g1_i1::g.15245  ORF type:complete len:310 (-),score=0.69 TRINITY_DN18759_c0_g1_i1:73-1002(-)